MFRLWGFLAHISQLTATRTWLFTPRGFLVGFAACKPRTCSFDANSLPAVSESGACNLLLVHFNHVISPKLRTSLLSWHAGCSEVCTVVGVGCLLTVSHGRERRGSPVLCGLSYALSCISSPFLSETFFKPIMWIFPPSPSLSVIPARSHKVAVLLLVHQWVARYLFSAVNISV